MIELNDKRLEDKIVSYCNENGIDYDDYIEEKIRDGFNTDIYGDMNEMLYGKPEKKTDEFEKSDERVLKTMKVEGRRLYIDFEGEEPIEISLLDFFDDKAIPIYKESNEEIVETSESNDVVEIVEETKPKRRKRTIKSN